MAKSNSNLVRVNMNLPKAIVDKVKDYAESLGVNTTNAYIYLITQALEQRNAMAQMPLILNLLNTLNNPQNLEDIQEAIGKIGSE